MDRRAGRGPAVDFLCSEAPSLTRVSVPRSVGERFLLFGSESLPSSFGDLGNVSPLLLVALSSPFVLSSISIVRKTNTPLFGAC